jgi:hypothetical protein
MATEAPKNQKGERSLKRDDSISTLEIRPIMPPGQAKPGQKKDEEDIGEFGDDDNFQVHQPESASLRFREPATDRFPLIRAYRPLFFGLSLFVLFLIAGFVWLRFSRDAQMEARKVLTEAKQLLETKGLAHLIEPVSRSLDRQINKWHGGPGSEKSAQRPWNEMECRFLIEEAISRRVKQNLDAEGRYLLISCQLAQDTPQVAVRSISEAHGEPSKLQREAGSWDLVPEQLIAAEAQRRLHAMEVRAALRVPTCEKWSASPGCLLRFVDQARQPLATKQDNSFALLEKVVTQKSARVQAWFYWAAGLSASKNLNKEQAEARLRKAAGKLAETREPFLKREIFRTRVRNAWIHRDRLLLQKVWKTRPKAEMEADRAGFLDVSLMHGAMLKPNEQSQELAEFFTRPESYQRHQFDPFFVRWLVERAIRQGLTESAQTYINRLSAGAEDYERVSEELSVLRVRILLARKQPLEALKLIQSMERFAQRSQELLHLKGLGLLMGFQTRQYRMLAAQELQKAVNAGARFEGYFAMIVAFLEAREWVKAEATLSFWRRDKLRSSEVVWISFAQGLIRYARGDLDKARGIWRELAQANPQFDVVRKLEQNLSEDPRYLENQLLNQLLLLLPPDSPLGPLALFGQKA